MVRLCVRVLGAARPCQLAEEGAVVKLGGLVTLDQFLARLATALLCIDTVSARNCEKRVGGSAKFGTSSEPVTRQFRASDALSPAYRFR